MKSLIDYLRIDPKVNLFELPLKVSDYLKFHFIRVFLLKLPFINSLYIDSSDRTMYWSFLQKYLFDTFNARSSVSPMFFRNRFLMYGTKVEAERDGRTVRGYGSDYENEEVAESKAMGEFLERYTTTFPSTDDSKFFHNKTVSELGMHTILPYTYHNYSKTLPGDAVFESVELENIINNTKIFYPRQLVFWAQRGNQQKEGGIIDSTTSGCAGGFTLEDATYSAILELVERDSFCMYWLTKTSPDIIEIPFGVFKEYDRLKAILDSANCSVYVLNTGTDLGIPSVVVAIVDNVSNAVCVSGGAGLNYQKAISSAVSEAYAISGIFDSKKEYTILLDYVPFSDRGMGRDERIYLWKSGKYLDKFKFFISGETVPYTQVKDIQVDNLVKVFRDKEQGYDTIYRYIVKASELQRLGFYVVRVIIPKLYPLYLNENMAITESKRLEEFNLYKNGSDQFEINTFPHMFP